MKNIKFTKETFKRMARTFIQAFVGYIGVNIVVIQFSDDKEYMKSALTGFCVSAIASGISAVMNLEEGDTE